MNRTDDFGNLVQRRPHPLRGGRFIAVYVAGAIAIAAFATYLEQMAG